MLIVFFFQVIKEMFKTLSLSLSIQLSLSLSIQFNMCFIGMTIVTMYCQSIVFTLNIEQICI